MMSRLEHMPIRLSVTRGCKVSFTFAFGYRFENALQGDCVGPLMVIAMLLTLHALGFAWR